MVMILMSDNPLLDLAALPRFPAIEAAHVRPALNRVLTDNRQALEALLADPRKADFEHLVLGLERLGHRLGRVWSPVSHLNAVASAPALREAYNECLPLLSEYASELGQNRMLFEAFERIASDGSQLDATQRRLLDHALRDFRLAGVALRSEDRQRFRALMTELSQLQASFEQNLLDASDAWRHHADDDAQVSGLPASTLRAAANAARAADKPGWLFQLDPPTYVAVMTHADDPRLREVFYRAWVTRGSDQGDHDAKFDNSALMQRILECRHEAATLLGFANFAELSLARKMAGSTEEVLSFLQDLALRCRPHALREVAELEALAGRTLAAWDVGYYSEKLRQARFDLSDEALKPYFPVPQVLNGLFRIVGQLYGLRVSPRDDVETWHADARYFDVHGRDGAHLGGFYIDLYARSGKRAGAWMDECVVRAAFGAEVSHPVAYLICNFPPPDEDAPSLLSHQDVVTLFHEFGHTLHHLLTRVDYPSLSGINGVPWDAVELPSQFFENWAWLPEAIVLISAHHETGEPLPAGMLQRLRESRVFQSGLQSVRQLEFALFDFRLHTHYEPGRTDNVERVLAEVRRELAVVPVPDYNRFAHGFSHVFGGGYAAGYYSYKWAEVLAADAFAAFEEAGAFDAATAQRFVDNILAVGGARDAMEGFVAFRGRRPDAAALLRQSGIAA